MFLSCLLIDTGGNPDRPRPGRRWLGNVYRVHQRLCMGFPSVARVDSDPEFLHPFRGEDFAGGHVRTERGAAAGFLFRVDLLPAGGAAVIVQSAVEPNWAYAFHNARHLLAAPPAVRPWSPDAAAGRSLRFRLLANPVRRLASGTAGKDGPRVPVPPTPDHLRAWLERRAARGGFELQAIATMVPGHVYMNPSPKRAGGVRYRSVRYEGTLRVTDGELFRASIARGIGPAKAFGFGLLSVAPA